MIMHQKLHFHKTMHVTTGKHTYDEKRPFSLTKITLSIANHDGRVRRLEYHVTNIH